MHLLNIQQQREWKCETTWNVGAPGTETSVESRGLEPGHPHLQRGSSISILAPITDLEELRRPSVKQWTHDKRPKSGDL